MGCVGSKEAQPRGAPKVAPEVAPAQAASASARETGLASAGVPSKQYSRGEAEALVNAALEEHQKLASLSSTRSAEGVAEVRRFMELESSSDVQQELNLCQTTAIAHALTLMGHPTSVDDIITLVKVPIESAVGDGMTLAEAHELALRYTEKARLPVRVDCHHFDAISGVTAARFLDACLADADAGAEEVLALNFHSGIAHGWPSGGGGHFGLLMGAVPASTRVEHELRGAMVGLGLDATRDDAARIVGQFGGRDGYDLLMADVHPSKYGAFWSCPLEQMFAAMVDKDSCGRSRGMLRFTRVPNVGLRKLPSAALNKIMKQGQAAVVKTCVNWAGSIPAGHPAFMLRRFIPYRWDSHIGTNNMGGMCALSLAINVVHGWTDEVELADCMMHSRSSHVEHLRKFQSSEMVAQVAARLVTNQIDINSKRGLATRHISFGSTIASFRKALVDAHVDLGTTVLILPFDTNVARGGAHVVLGNTEAALMKHGAKIWAAVASFDLSADDEDELGVVLCSATEVIRDGRLWSTSVARLFAATRSGEVRDGGGVVVDFEIMTNQARMDQLFKLIDRDHDGKVSADELYGALTEAGFDASQEEAKELVASFDFDGDNNSLTRDEVFEMFNKVLGFHPAQTNASARRQQMLSTFMADHGCFRNELGFSTCHLAVETADIPANVAFYNGVLGWPIYKTVDRAHAGNHEDSYGSSWASYGAFASFIVFHKEEPPIGKTGHGPWASRLFCPEELMPRVRAAEQDAMAAPHAHHDPTPLPTPASAGSIALDDITYPCFGTILEPAFFAMQMERIAAKSPELRWLDVTDAGSALGGGIVDRAVVLRDPDGWPLILFVSTLSGDDYTARHPAVPFVFCFEFRQSPSVEVDKLLIQRPITPAMERMLEQDQMAMTKSYYTDTLGATLIDESTVGGTHRLMYEWCGHYLCMQSNPTYVPPALREAKATDSSHNMGANKGVVPMPHFGPNTSYTNFDLIRGRVDTAMAQHGIPVEDMWCLTRTGRAPPFDHINAHNMLFPSDPDSCLSQFLTDPSGNAFEVKWYLDFGEMFHHSGEVGVGGLMIDNSLVPEHFPPAVRALMQQRVRKGDAVGRDAEKRSG